MSVDVLEPNLLPASDQLLKKNPWREGMTTWLEDKESWSLILEQEWNSPYTVVFLPKHTGKTWNRKNIELQSKVVAVYQAVGLAQPIDEREADLKLFTSLVSEWHKERRDASWIVEIAMCPSYQKIIAMGKKRAVPLILKQLEEERDEPDHWFWALRILTDANPVPDEHKGNIVEMANDWIEWGKKNGYAG